MHLASLYSNVLVLAFQPHIRHTVCMSIVNPHDKIFREIESIRENAADFIAGTFPRELLQGLDLETLELDPSSYISEDLEETFSDLVYSCQYNAKTPITIALLFEHKSSPVRYPHFQLLKYMLSIWKKCIQDSTPLKIVVPVIFYHGTKPWQLKPVSAYFEGIDATLSHFIPDFSYILTDLSCYDDQAIRDTLFQRDANRILMQLLKYVFDERLVDQHFTEIFSPGRDAFTKPEGQRLLMSILVYLYNTTELSPDSVIQRLSRISPEGGKIAMTTALKLREEGIAEGFEKGIEKGIKENARRMLNDGQPVAIIAKYTGLTPSEIEALREEND